MRILLRFLTVLLLSGVAVGQGNLTVAADAVDQSIAVHFEQRVGQWAGWDVYAGSGFEAVVGGSVTEFSPYVLACKSPSVGFALFELCGEVNVPVVGSDWSFKVFTSVVW